MRIAATPNTKPYGRLAVLAQSVATAHVAFDVPASAFTPPPKVDSAVIVLDILPEKQRYSDLKMLGRVTAAAFGQRRKMLRKSLRGLASDLNIDLETWLSTANIDPRIRPETLDIKGFHTLTDFSYPPWVKRLTNELNQSCPVPLHAFSGQDRP